MSGGGGSDKKTTDTKTPATTTPTPSVPAQTFQPMMPGFQNMLAEQLYAGYGSGGGSVPDFLAMLSNLYQPMTLGRAKTGTGTTGTGGTDTDTDTDAGKTGPNIKLRDNTIMNFGEYLKSQGRR